MKFGYQTLTWANYYDKYEIEQPIKEIKEIGFEGIEFIEPLSKLGTPTALSQLLERAGLKVVSISCGLNMNPGDSSDIDETKMRVKFANELGIKEMMLCGGWRSDEVGKTEESYKILADKLNVCCEYASQFGMNIAFHPHKNTIVETREDIEGFLKFTDKFKLCLDIAHLAACGSDPAEAIRAFRDITTYIHLKDWDIEKDDFTELGRGEVDIMRCVAVLKEIGYNGWAVVELDRTTRTPEESARISADYLHRARLL
jgi:inosose dehydratase